MKLFQSVLELAATALHPACPKCGMAMRLVLIEAEAEHDKSIYACIACGHDETRQADYAPSDSAPVLRSFLETILVVIAVLPRTIVQKQRVIGREQPWFHPERTTSISGFPVMDRVDQSAYRDVRNPHDRALFQDGLRTLFPACNEAAPPEMERLLE